jgi:hypothetical protein
VPVAMVPEIRVCAIQIHFRFIQNHPQNHVAPRVATGISPMIE